jgi:hypothetical protein
MGEANNILVKAIKGENYFSEGGRGAGERTTGYRIKTITEDLIIRCPSTSIP